MSLVNGGSGDRFFSVIVIQFHIDLLQINLLGITEMLCGLLHSLQSLSMRLLSSAARTKIHYLKAITSPDGTQRALASFSFECLFALSSCTEQPASQLALVVRGTSP